MKEYTKKIHFFLSRHSNIESAEAMSHTTKGAMKFLGIKTANQKDVFKTIFKLYPLPKYSDTKDIIRELFAFEEREYLYFGMALFAKRMKFWQKTDIVFVESMILSQPGWDIIEHVTAEVLPCFYEKYPKIALEFLNSWSVSKNQWLKATAIMFQRTCKENTDCELLGKYIMENLNTNYDIVDRAIGAALRCYSKTNHKWVLNFVVQNSATMNKKAKHEAIKWIDSKGLIK